MKRLIQFEVQFKRKSLIRRALIF